MAANRRNDLAILRVAKQNFHFDELRPGQREAIESILAGHDTLVVQPTGAGKSAVYQIAGLIRPGMTVVVSPLIALQRDQLDALAEIRGAEAASINSTLSAGEARERLEATAEGEIAFLFVAPEQLRKQEVLERLRNAQVTQFVVDEAHCISEWGHDFRPDYLGLGRVIEALGHPVTVALTATATGRVRDEIIERLGMRAPTVLVGGFDRPNIALSVEQSSTEADKMEALLRHVNWIDTPGVIYAGTRQHCETIRAALQDADTEAVFYHAGLRAKERHAIQRRFMDGQVEVIVATNAFGMGIDKPDIRFVFHYDVPDALEAYYQEVGRAGRDQDPAQAILLYRESDLRLPKFHAARSTPNRARLRQVLEAIGALADSATIGTVSAHTGLSPRQLMNTARKLEEAGVVSLALDGSITPLGNEPPAAALDRAEQRQRLHRNTLRERLQRMQEYAELTTCRRAFILRYFGEDAPDTCNACDNCQKRAGATSEEAGTPREVTV